MVYVISDIHGCYDEFRELLEKIDFSEKDELYILGDIVDRGPEPMKILLDLMERPNVYPVLGNHEYMALMVLRRLNVEITEENFATHITVDDMNAYMNWMQDGGNITANSFRKLDYDTREAVLEYLQEFSLYEEITVNGREYVLVHAGIHNFDEGKSMEEYSYSDFIFWRTDYSRRYFLNKFLVTGHTPTFKIHGRHEVYEEEGHIAIDCGCVYGGRLAAYCLDTLETFYVCSKQQ